MTEMSDLCYLRKPRMSILSILYNINIFVLFAKNSVVENHSPLENENRGLGCSELAFEYSQAYVSVRHLERHEDSLDIWILSTNKLNPDLLSFTTLL